MVDATGIVSEPINKSQRLIMPATGMVLCVENDSRYCDKEIAAASRHEVLLHDVSTLVILSITMHVLSRLTFQALVCDSIDSAKPPASVYVCFGCYCVVLLHCMPAVETCCLCWKCQGSNKAPCMLRDILATVKVCIIAYSVEYCMRTR